MKVLQHKKLLIGIGVGIVVIIAGIIIFMPKSSATQSLRQTSTVAKGTIVQKVTSTGQVNSVYVQNAGFKVAGTITSINVKVGDVVKKGQVIASIDRTQLQLQVDKSQIALNTADNNLKNAYLKGKYTDYDIANYKNQIKSAQTTLDIDKQNLQYADLTADIDGTVVLINAQTGSTVTASGSNSQITTSAQGSAVMVIQDLNNLSVVVAVSEGDISKVQVNQLVELTFDSIKDKTYTGKVTSVDLLGQSSSGVVSYNVKVKFDKPDSSVRIGMNANASIIVNTRKDVLIVPSNYIKTVNGIKQVTVSENGKDIAVAVETGASDDTNTEIISGLTEGQTIVRVTTAASSTKRTSTSLSIPGLTGGAGTNRQVNFRGN